jgi:alpha-tubulin suppressor-like RCC1 family protein
LGEYHTTALTDSGDVFTWGYGGKEGYFNWMYSQEVGALGHGDKAHHFKPKRVKYFNEKGIKISQIGAGLYHNIALAESGELYTWGRGQYGVLGNGSNQYSLTPQVNDFMLGL